MKAAVAVLLVAAALLTQQWVGWERGFELGGDDAQSYEEIARSAPAWPGGDLPFHHAQRMAGPYLVGLAARATGHDVRTLLRASTAACLLLSVLFLASALARLGLAGWDFAICLGLFALHFSMRFYLVAPGMLPDAMFICGLTLVLSGLAGGSLAPVLAGALLAATGRQTALLIFPGVALWLAASPRWTARPAGERGLAVALVLGIVSTVYLATAHAAAAFGLLPENLDHLTALGQWLVSPEFSPEELTLFGAYVFVPMALSLAVIVAAAAGQTDRCRQPEFVAAIVIALGVAIQPILGGPEVTGANAVRLVGLGQAAFVVAAASLLRPEHPGPSRWGLRGPWAFAALLLASLHYHYTWLGPQTPLQFALIHLAAMVCLAGLVRGRAGAR